MTAEEYAALNAAGRAARAKELIGWVEDAERIAGDAMWHGADVGRDNPVATLAEAVVELARLVHAMTEGEQR